MLADVIYFLIGLLLLGAGAECLVRSASRLAIATGISPLVVGLTVVAFGTSAPELIVSSLASFKGANDIAIGNIIGSNIFNTFFILGLSAICTPLALHPQLLKFDIPFMCLVSVIAYYFAFNGEILRGEGIALCVLLVIYTIALVFLARKESPEVKDEFTRQYAIVCSKKVLALSVLGCVAGCVLLAWGAERVVNSAVLMAEALGFSELFIGLTIVAAGTSLPELATCVLAALRGNRDIAVGNVVGSNIFNLLGAIGLSAILSKGNLTVAQELLYKDVPFLVVGSLFCLGLFVFRKRIGRLEGVLLLSAYVVYILVKFTA